MLLGSIVSRPLVSTASLIPQPSSFVNCSEISLNEDSVRTKDNSWGAFEPVVESLGCPSILASNISSDPIDWLQMCSENHYIYQHYMAYKSRNHLKRLIPPLSDVRLNETVTGGRPSFLVIGDSLDKFMAYHMCNLTRGVVTKVDPPQYRFRRPFYCSSPTLEIGYLNIFGMSRTCDNAGVAHHQDSRSYNSTLDRVIALLPDILKLFDKPPQYIQIGSALWDLSHGCVSRNGIPKKYREEYEEGMHRLNGYLISGSSGVQRDASIYWRTSPPLRKSYSAKWARISWVPFNVGAHGRTRRNQRILNSIVHDVFSSSHLGKGVIDWWEIADSAPEAFLNKELPDGRHYTFCSSLAFFNEWLDQINQVSRRE